MVEENEALKKKLKDKEHECEQLQSEVKDVQMKMAEIVMNITHLNEASTPERRSGKSPLAIPRKRAG